MEGGADRAQGGDGRLRRGICQRVLVEPKTVAVASKEDDAKDLRVSAHGV